ncbi:MAG TPA: serine/threonine-protein kinase, partial [Phototrophicaceae bacterium]|nr:serine/threonine-protein kinase [Phototrophicaceae bacterium]
MSLINHRYQLLERIGEGGMGVVFRAQDRLLNQVIALKSVTYLSQPTDKIPSQVFSDTRMNMAQEFRITAGLRHPNIVSVLDYGFDAKGLPYYTMPLLLHAKSLTDAAKDYDVQHKTLILVDLLQALIYLHRHGVIHRDLKPENVLIVRDEGVRVLDFGIATRDTSSEDIVGTLHYIAPEVLQTKPASSSSDLYAVGVIAFELYAGRKPFEGEDLSGVILKTAYEKPPLHLLPIDPGLVDFVGCLLAKKPEERYASATHALNELSRLIGIAGGESLETRESLLQAAQFVGRETELAQLQQALDQAQTGKGSAWLIGGESGVGKSRLLEELRVRALVAGMLTLRGQAVEGGGLRYQLWRDVLPQLILSTTISDLEAGILHEIVPHIALLLEREVIPAAPVMGAGQQQRLTETICDLFQRQTQPMLLLLEDLQWTTESLDVLKALLPMVQDLPLLIVGSYRPDEA